ncbi:vacuolar transporter chaperone [Apophysomyces ossiformis]|uniref:Vacuolar transporter chaperone n=1 Tax=Apophysomyces ossiformis TaxID=679940 RepID=A0A8H7EUF9_9FUNG|nr:vacuolar transporter chaperone [Apophysomyces ossiformis]
MKFGQYLNQNLYAPWLSSYLQYDRLKYELKTRQLDHPWNMTDESYFKQCILTELSKVDAFIARKAEELNNRIRQEEHRTLPNSMRRREGSLGRTSPDAWLLAMLDDIHRLSSFIRLNCTGFQKILKKHDKWTNLGLQQSLIPQFQECRLDIQRLDPLLARIARLRERHGQSVTEQPDVTPDKSETITKTYWVHPCHLAEVKAVLLFHLSVRLCKNTITTNDAAETTLSTIYFDNPNHFDLYFACLQRTEGAEYIRFEWYLFTLFYSFALYKPDHSAMFFFLNFFYNIKRTTSSQGIEVVRRAFRSSSLDETAIVSIENRFRLDPNRVDAFITGQLTPDQLEAELRERDAPQAVVLNTGKTAEAVQRSIGQKKLEPVLRCVHRRMVFGEHSQLQIYLDSDLRFVREDSLGKWRRHSGPWQREDLQPMKEDETHAAEDNEEKDEGGGMEKASCGFPYVVLQANLPKHLPIPAWLTQLGISHLVHEVPRFSKYIHGASQLHQLALLPWWLSELKTDLQRNSGPEEKEEQEAEKETVLLRQSGLSSSHEGVGSSPGEASGRRMIWSEKSQPKNRKQRWPWLPRRWAKRKKNNKTQEILPLSNSKVKIEPKTYFANERTFISWLQFCALLLTVSLSLLNFGDHVSRLVGGCFIVIAALLAIYALWRYQYRAWQIRTRSTARYDDLYGPAVLCLMLLVALIVNFCLRFQQPVPNSPSPYGSNNSSSSSASFG